MLLIWGFGRIFYANYGANYSVNYDANYSTNYGMNEGTNKIVNNFSLIYKVKIENWGLDTK